MNTNKPIFKALNNFLTEYSEKNLYNVYRPVAVGKYGIRKRESIYSKELASDYSKNKVIYKNTLTVGMGSNQIDIGILTDDEMYSVSPAYHTYKISGINAKYLEYCLKYRNNEMFEKYSKRGARQGKSIEFKKWLTYKIPVFPIDVQEDIVNKLKVISSNIEVQNQKMDLYKELIKSRFIEMFGDPVFNTKGYPELSLPKLGTFGRGVSKHRPRNAPALLGGKYPLIQTGDVANADLYIEKYNSTYSELGLKQSKMWKSGTLCITIAANIAKTAILTFDACFPDSVVGFTANERTNNIFIHYWFSFLQKIIEEQAPETAQKNINLGTLSGLSVIVPPINEQNRFAEWIKEIQKLLKVVNQQINYNEELLIAEMHNYFDQEGEC